MALKSCPKSNKSPNLVTLSIIQNFPNLCGNLSSKFGPNYKYTNYKSVKFDGIGPWTDIRIPISLNHRDSPVQTKRSVSMDFTLAEWWILDATKKMYNQPWAWGKSLKLKEAHKQKRIGRCKSQPVWPDLAKVCNFGAILKALGIWYGGFI